MWKVAALTVVLRTQVFLVFIIKRHDMWGSKGNAPCVLNLSTRRKVKEKNSRFYTPAAYPEAR